MIGASPLASSKASGFGPLIIMAIIIKIIVCIHNISQQNRTLLYRRNSTFTADNELSRPSFLRGEVV